MRSRLILALLLFVLVSSVCGFAQPPRHRAVIQVSSILSNGWVGTLGYVDALRESFGPHNVDIEVVVLGQAIMMLHRNDTDFASRIKRLSDSGVRFVACGKTMKAAHLTAADMFPFITIVDSGAAELVRRQEEGWSYLKGDI